MFHHRPVLNPLVFTRLLKSRLIYYLIVAISQLIMAINEDGTHFQWLVLGKPLQDCGCHDHTHTHRRERSNCS